MKSKTGRPRRTPTRRAARVLLPLLVLASALALPLATAGAAELPVLRDFCPTGEAGGQCTIPTGIVVDPESGDVYVNDGSGNYRIEKFTAWGQFLRAWGWDVVKSGPDDKAAKDEIEEVSVDATGGSFALELMDGNGEFHDSAPISFNASAAAVQNALEASAKRGPFNPGDLIVSGPAGGPWTIEFSGSVSDLDFSAEVLESTLSGATATAAVTTVQNGGNFEVCVPAVDVCKRGQKSRSGGGVAGGGGLTLDSAGDVYVGEPAGGESSRVQKFSPQGEFLLTFGGEVNETRVRERQEEEANAEPVTVTEAQENLCTAASGDICKGGTEGTGNGQFGDQPFSASIGASPDGETIYVGDVDRIEEFDTAGEYVGQLPLPEAGTVGALAVDPQSGDIYFGYKLSATLNPPKQPGIHRLDPTSGEELDTLDVPTPLAIAVDADGDVYAYQQENLHSSTPPIFDSEFLEFDPSGNLIRAFPKAPFTSDPIGMATSSACGIEGADLFISNRDFSNSFVRILGSPPQDVDPPCSAPPSLAPAISETYATSVGAVDATVAARINPHFWPDTAYHVEYATAACIEDEGGWSAPCVKRQPVAQEVQLTGSVIDADLTTKGIFLGAGEALVPGTGYRYRFIAKSSGGGPVAGAEAAFRTYPLSPTAKTDCPDQGFRSAASAALPDCRAYEMVSPPEKGGGEVASPRFEDIEQAAVDGEALTFVSLTAFGDAVGAPFGNQYVSRRTPDGWSTDSINVPGRPPELNVFENLNSRYKLFDESLCNGWVLQNDNVALVEGAPAGVAGLYRRQGLHAGCGAGGYELLTTVFPPGFESEAGKSPDFYPHSQGFSADGQISVFQANAALAPNACHTPDEGKGIYQVYLGREGTPGVAPTLVSALPDGQPACTPSSVGAAHVFGGLNTLQDQLYHAVSEDGSRVYWSTDGSGELGLTGEAQIYLRVNAGRPQSALKKNGSCSEATKACTYAVSKEAETASGTKASGFLSGSADGSAAIFFTGPGEGKDLYEFSLARALAGEAPDTLIAHGVLGILGASADASRVYLVSTEALGGGGQAGRPNLYLYTRGAGTRFVATLAAGTDVQKSNYGTRPSSIETEPRKHLARVGADGLRAVFTSASPALAKSVAGYDNTDVHSGKADREVYLYDASAEGGTGKLVCASCNPSGARPAGRLVLHPNGNPENDIWAAAQIPGWITATHPGNLLSADGRLFFESFEALVPRDTNGRADVYEWEAASGSDACLHEIGGELFEPDSGGCLSLISSGQGGSDAQLVDASADGRDVFFRTDAGLLPQDISFADIYDARIDGGFPPAPAPPAPCEGETCQPPSEAPNDPTPASAGFRGAAGGPAARPARCGKGRHRVKGRKGKSRCVPTRKKGQRQRRHARHHHRRAHR